MAAPHQSLPIVGHLHAQARYPCIECGWLNRTGRGCCESCGQEDWEGRTTPEQKDRAA